VPEQPHLEELSRAVADGLLAEEVVFATSRLIRHEPLAEDEKLALANGRLLLQFLASPEPGPPRPEGFEALATDESALDTLRAVRLQAPDENVRNLLERMVATLDDALAERDLADATVSLERIRDLFASLGSLTLARANALTRFSEEGISWMGTTSTSDSSSQVLGEPSINS